MLFASPLPPYPPHSSQKQEPVWRYWNLVRKASWFPSWGGEINRESGFSVPTWNTIPLTMGKTLPQTFLQTPNTQPPHAQNHQDWKRNDLQNHLSPTIHLPPILPYYTISLSTQQVEAGKSFLNPYYHSSADFYFCPNPLIKHRESYFLQYFWSISLI